MKSISDIFLNMKMRLFFEILIFVGIFLGTSVNSKKGSLLLDIRENQDYLEEMLKVVLDQYNSMYFHQGKRGGKGRWSNGIGGLPSPRIAKKYIVSFIQSEPEENLFGSLGTESYIRMCVNLIDIFPRLHHGVGDGILIAIHSYQEEEYNIIKGFCTEAAMMHFFKKEMESMIAESLKPNSLVPHLVKSIFDYYEVGGNWSDFVENCEDIIQEYKKKYTKKANSKWSDLDISEISDFCEEVADDIYPNFHLSNKEWSHIYSLQNYIIKKRGKMGAPILGIPKKRPPYYVAGRHQSSMYRKCLRALWDMFQYDEDIDLKIAGKYQYETLRSFCDAAKNYYTRGGRISASPMIQISEPNKSVRTKKNKKSLVKQILDEQMEREQKERAIAFELRRNFEKKQNRKIKKSRDLRKHADQEEIIYTPEFPIDGVTSFNELPTPDSQTSIITPKSINLSIDNQENDVPNISQDLDTSDFTKPDLENPESAFGIDIAKEEFKKIIL